MLNPVYVTDSKTVQLLPPSCFETPVDSLQVFKGTFGNKSFVSSVYVQADGESVVLIILNDFGIQTGLISYDGKNCTMDSALFPSRLKAEYIICDFENAYGDFFTLYENYKKSGFLFTEDLTIQADGTEKKIRSLYENKRLIEQITVTKNSSGKTEIVIKNYLRDYSYELSEAAQ